MGVSTSQRSHAIAGVTLAVDDQLRFPDEAARQWYTVQAVSSSGRWVAVTRKAFGTVLYTVLDTDRGVRGVDNSLGNSLGYETRQQCEEAVALLEQGSFRLSTRRGGPVPVPSLELRSS